MKNRELTIISGLFTAVYFISAVLGFPPLVRIITSFPVIFVLPGLLLLLMLRRKEQQFINAKLIVEGFFISTLLGVFVASLCVVLGVALTSLFFSLFYTFLIFVLVSLLYLLKVSEINITRFDILLLAVFALIYFALIVLFLSVPRYLTPDETNYIFYARKILLDGQAFPLSISPARDTISALIMGRYVWSYLVAVFLGSTGVQPYYANLIGPAFLSMMGLASTELIPERIKKNRELRLVTFLVVATSPLLVLFSGFALNDLALAFYVLFSVVFLAKSFNKIGNEVTINFGNLMTSIIAVAVVSLIKNNIVFLAGMWLVIVYVVLRYKLYSARTKIKMPYRILLLLVVIVPLAYEFVLDIPYVVTTWFVRNPYVSHLTRQFLVVSPAEMILSMFMSPWVNPSMKNIFTIPSIDYIDSLYTLLSPEAIGVSISSALLLLPFFLRRLRQVFQQKIVACSLLISVPVFYFLGLSAEIFGSMPRLALWIIPLLIPLSLFIFYVLFSERCYVELISIQVVTILLLWMNWTLVNLRGGTYIGYGLPRFAWTYEILIIGLIVFTILISILHLKSIVTLKFRRVFSGGYSHAFSVNFAHSSSKVFYAFIAMVLVSSIYMSSFVVQNCFSFQDHGLVDVSNAIENSNQGNNLTIANNFYYMRAYVSDRVFKGGLFLPPPDTQEEFFSLLKLAPNNTNIIITNDIYVSSYEYAKTYAKYFATSEAIAVSEAESAESRTEISSPFGNTTIFQLIDSNTPNQESSITVKSAEITIGDNSSIVLKIIASSSKPENATILVGTDAFTKVIPVSLDNGDSDIKLVFEYQSPDGGLYWEHLGEARVLLLDFTGKVVYNEYVSRIDIRVVNFLFMALASVLLCLLIVSRKHS